jgi:hypothetical protein
MGFNLDNYQTVAERLSLWLDDCKERGVQPRVVTEIVSHTETWVMFKGYIYENDVMIATGHAEEHKSDRGVNATSHVENAETSVLGRCLANAGWAGSDPAKRASREEMTKVQRNNPITGAPPRAEVGSRAKRPATEKQIGYLKTLNARKGRPLNDEQLAKCAGDFDLCSREIETVSALEDVK